MALQWCYQVTPEILSPMSFRCFPSLPLRIIRHIINIVSLSLDNLSHSSRGVAAVISCIQFHCWLSVLTHRQVIPGRRHLSKSVALNLRLQLHWLFQHS